MKHFRQLKKGGYPAMLDLGKVNGWWPDNQCGTVVLVYGQEVWTDTDCIYLEGEEVKAFVLKVITLGFW